MNDPRVSILMVARNAAPFIDAALLSARDQTVCDIEIVVVDDGSSDRTRERAQRHSCEDPRVRVLDGPRRGLSAVRNVSMDAAKGRFALVLDSDDVLDPRHVERLLAGQRGQSAPLCATNMIEFSDEDGGFHVQTFAQGVAWQSPRIIAPADFVATGAMDGQRVSLGYLKPLFDLTFMRARELRYDERLRIGEDFDLVLRAMLAGGRFQYLPCPTYYYRRHAASISHRLSRVDVDALLLAAREYQSTDDKVQSALSARQDHLEAVLLHLDTIEAIKSANLTRAAWLLSRHRTGRQLTLMSLREAVTKRLRLPRSRSDFVRAAEVARHDTPGAYVQAVRRALEASAITLS